MQRPEVMKRSACPGNRKDTEGAAHWRAPRAVWVAAGAGADPTGSCRHGEDSGFVQPRDAKDGPPSALYVRKHSKLGPVWQALGPLGAPGRAPLPLSPDSPRAGREGTLTRPRPPPPLIIFAATDNFL